MNVSKFLITSDPSSQEVYGNSWRSNGCSPFLTSDCTNDEGCVSLSDIRLY